MTLAYALGKKAIRTSEVWNIAFGGNPCSPEKHDIRGSVNDMAQC